MTNDKNKMKKVKPRLMIGITASAIVVSTFASSLAFIRNQHENTGKSNVYSNVVSTSTNETKALEGDPPEEWDQTKVTPVKSADGEWVPVPVGFTVSTSENERYVNGNVTKKGTLSNLTFSANAGDANPWTENSSNIWVSGNKQQPNSTSELVSDPITVGANGGWVQIEWSVCSQSGYDVLSMTVNDTVNGTSELIKEISGNAYGTAEASLIYTKCGKELTQGTYTISVKYSKYNNTTHTGLDSGYVKSGTYIAYDENGADELAIHKTGGFVIYEGTEAITDIWTASKERNQYVWVPVEKPDDSTEGIYEKNATTGKIKAKLWNTTAAGRSKITNNNGDNKREAGVLFNQSNDYYDNIRYFTASKVGSYYGMGMPGYSKDTLYKELETEYKNTIKSIEKYGGFYIGRYETGSLSRNTSSTVPVVRRMNSTISNYSWYEMYPKMRNMSSNPNIQTSMIWGSLYDATLEWIIKSGDKARVEISTDSTSWGNYYNSTFKYYNSNGELTSTKNMNSSSRIPTGSTERNSANNIYDLAGNVWDWTLEGSGSYFRYYRGGGCNGNGTNGPAHVRSDDNPNYYFDDIGFRAYFYIK